MKAMGHLCNPLKSTFKLPLLKPRRGSRAAAPVRLCTEAIRRRTMVAIRQYLMDAAITAIATSCTVIITMLGASLALISVLTKTWHKQLGERFDSFFGVQIEVWLRRPPRLDCSMRISNVWFHRLHG